MDNLKDTPRFAIVGHPNKGKSSIVATLAKDDRVAISAIPGTTTVSNTFPMTVEGETLYELIDTPGFQRARKVLDWLQDLAKANNWAANERFKAIKAFVEDSAMQKAYPDEYELLKPLVNGAGVLYVVDGSKPYGREYESEMEILRWTGQPSMALINMIGRNDFSGQWQSALGQYFKIVRMFNPFYAEEEKRLSILEAFGEVYLPWKPYLTNAVAILKLSAEQKKVEASNLIAQTIKDAMTYSLKQKATNNGIDDDRDKTYERYLNDIRKLEIKTRKAMAAIYQHNNLELNNDNFELLNVDLFSKQVWSFFGLSEKELLATGLVGGAAAGSVIDVMTGGLSLLGGAGIGAIAGGLGVWFSQSSIAKIKVLGFSVGEQVVQVGPTKNSNFPYVLLARLLMYHQALALRTHAQQGELEVDGKSGASIIDAKLRKQLEKHFIEIRSTEKANMEVLTKLIKECVENIKS